MSDFETVLEMANAGDLVSQYRVGLAYEVGDVVEKDLTTAKMWYEKSATGGYKNAEIKLRILAIKYGEEKKETPHNSDVDIASTNTTTNLSVSENNESEHNTPKSEEVVSQPLNNQQSVKTEKNKTVAILFAAFLGCWGAHDFYLNRTTQGVIKIALTSTIIGIVASGIWAIIDLVNILSDPDVLIVKK